MLFTFACVIFHHFAIFWGQCKPVHDHRFPPIGKHHEIATGFCIHVSPAPSRLPNATTPSAVGYSQPPSVGAQPPSVGAQPPSVRGQPPSAVVLVPFQRVPVSGAGNTPPLHAPIRMLYVGPVVSVSSNLFSKERSQGQHICSHFGVTGGTVVAKWRTDALLPGSLVLHWVSLHSGPRSMQRCSDAILARSYRTDPCGPQVDLALPLSYSPHESCHGAAQQHSPGWCKCGTSVFPVDFLYQTYVATPIPSLNHSVAA